MSWSLNVGPILLKANKRRKYVPSDQASSLRFVDLFAGCGGLSLGLLRAGLECVLAVEAHPHAFETYRENLLNGNAVGQISWPRWLPQEPIEIGRLLSTKRAELERLRGRVDLVAGGPPCQGFSFAGSRSAPDPRNRLFRRYVQFVEAVRPRFLLMENVRGFAIPFGKGTPQERPPYSDRLSSALRKLGYEVRFGLIHAQRHGVPQTRVRFILFGVHMSALARRELPDPFGILEQTREEFLRSRGLPIRRPVSVGEAISDLEVGHCGSTTYETQPAFNKIRYRGPRTKYQREMHGDMNGKAPNSLRLANHRRTTVRRFSRILRSYRRGVLLSPEERRRLGMSKHVVVALDRNRPAHTLTSLPDDLIHYAEPRILTVRECARLQTFPDSFSFHGKYTTGDKLRRIDCPRYTQVANAVPPFLGEQLGLTLMDLDRSLRKR